jgi:ABC-type lipoprotein release transport system permease subunit
MSPHNATVTVVCVLALGLSALLACLIRALRTSRISPMEALRAE